MDTKDLSKQFGESVVFGLVTFQLIEDSLKQYIKFSFKLIRAKLDKSIPFKFEGDDLQDAALGTLIKTFSKLSNNEELRLKLIAVTSKRDYIAHRALVSYLKSAEDEAKHEEHKEKITAISIEAWVCLGLLHLELEALDKRIMAL